jgi:hypothetical protein
MCGLGAARCRKALEENGGDVEKALAALIDAGEVKSADLDPDTVSDALFGRASQREREGFFTEMLKPSGSFFDALPEEFREDFKAELARAAEAAEAAHAAQDPQRLGFSARVFARAKRRQLALDKKPVVLNLPPFPPLTLTLNGWAGEDVLKTWSGFGERRGSKGKVTVSLPRAPNDEDDANPVPPPPEMAAAYAHLKANEAGVTAAVLDAVRSYVNELTRKRTRDPEPVRDNNALKRMMSIDSVHPLSVAKDGISYLGMFFHCTWDPEHAAGVLVHGSRVVKVGDNEVAGDEFAAIEDGGTEIRGWERGLADALARSRAGAKPPWVQ